jgi:hypothetical protein
MGDGRMVGRVLFQAVGLLILAGMEGEYDVVVGK